MTGPALKLTEAQVAELEAPAARYRSDLPWPTRIRQLISDWRSLRAALDEQVKENEQQVELVGELRGLVADACANTFEWRDRATRDEAALASVNEIIQAPRGPEYALLAAQGKQPEGALFNRPTDPSSEHWPEECSPAPQSPDQACGAETIDEWLSDVIEMARDQRSDGGFELSVSEVIGNAKVGSVPALASRPDTALVREKGNDDV